MHDVFNNVTPPNVSNFYTYSSKVHNRNKRFSVAGNFCLQYSRTDHLKNSFSNIGAKIWNTISPGGGGDSNMEKTGMLVGNFEFNP